MHSVYEHTEVNVLFILYFYSETAHVNLFSDTSPTLHNVNEMD